MLPGAGGGAEAQHWHSNMQLTDKVVLSAAALLLVTAAYRLYKSRPAQTSPGGGHAQAKEEEEEAEGSGEAAVQRTRPGAPPWGLRHRRGSRGSGAPPDSIRETSGGSPQIVGPEQEGAAEEQGGQHPGGALWLPGGQGAGAAVGGKPELPPHPDVLSEPERSPVSLTAADASGAGAQPGPWRDRGSPEPPGAADRECPHQRWLAPAEGASDMAQGWVYPGLTGLRREEAGALRAASDLALHQQPAAADAAYTFSSVAHVHVEDFIPDQAEGAGPRLKGKVYDYYVESTSQATSEDALAPRTAALERAPGPTPDPLAAEAAWQEPAGGAEGGDGGGAVARTQPASPRSGRGLARKQSLLQIVDNPELQLQLDGFGAPAPPGPPSGLPSSPGPREPPPGPAGASGEPRVQLVAGTNFFHLPLNPEGGPGVRLDLGNCSEVLRLAKRQNLEALKEAAYKVLSDNYLQVLRSPDLYASLSGAERELILRRRLCGRKHLVVADVCPHEDSGRLCCYDAEQDAWHPLAQLPPEAVSRGGAVCSLFNYLFVVSGCQGPGRRPSGRVFCYNPLTGIWSEVCPLNQARPNCRLVALDGRLYAIGGECLRTVECYDPRLDRWTFAPPLPNDTFALAHTATACAGELFVTGGTLRYLLLRFSAREQTWRAGPTAGGKDRTAEMVAVGGFLYRFDLQRSLGVGVYRCSAGTRLWYECAAYRTPYPDAFQCAVVDNLIYCVGRRRTLAFLADHVSPRFVPRELRSFPSPQGTLLPTVLTLPGPSVPQTTV